MSGSGSNGETRAIVIVGPNHIDGLSHAELEQAGWEIHATPDPAYAREIVEQHDIVVGLLHLTAASTANSQSIEDLLLETNWIRWIGLLEPALLENENICELISCYLHDYHTLPADIERLTTTLGHGLGMADIELAGSLPRLSGVNDQTMVAESPAMQRVSRTLNKLSRTEAAAILTGESGTGKELVARAIHDQSVRALGPFIAVNCGSLPANLIQSELFGHEKGAFTGAHRDRIGRIEAASGGTIFLDEIGDLSLDLQVNLLRFLQEGTIERVGRAEPIKVDVRVVAATHVDLQAAVKNGTFREDLYYRLNVLRLELPPLRERDGDVERLAEHYFKIFAKERKKRIRGFSGSALLAMKAYTWPGNVRELINRVHRGLVMCDNYQITPKDLGLERSVEDQSVQTLADIRMETERRALQKALLRCSYNVSKAARQLSISRITMYRLMEKHGLSRTPASAADDMHKTLAG
ncbi:MAG: sigma-54 dependent transcriptional regulator [Gammaproteobacteria bacterium]